MPDYDNFQQERKEGPMGTACICYKQPQNALPPPLLLPLSLQGENDPRLPSHRHSPKKFMDIQDQQEESLLSDLDLNRFNQELSRCLVEYETKNGPITRRFTQRILEPSSRVGRSDLSLPLDRPSASLPAAQHTAKADELYLPLTSENEDLEIQQSGISEPEATGSNNKSCLLSLSSRVLNDSLFTARAHQKQQFYSLHNKLGSIILQSWCDNDRASLEFEAEEMKTLQSDLDGRMATSLTCIYQFWESHFIHLLTCCHASTGIKLYLNGEPRKLPLPSEPSLLAVQQQFVHRVPQLDVPDLTYTLTGWMPERIFLSEIKNFAGILERLATNLQEGNTLISFTRCTELGEEHATLLRIDFETATVHLKATNHTSIPEVLLETLDQQRHELAINFESFVELYDVINLNWNPYIYDLKQACECILSPHVRTKKFLLVIPPSSQDLEIRLFLQRHQDFANPSRLGVVISLHEYTGSCEIGDGEAIRTMETSEAIYSDVFIFEYCKDKTQYLLSLELKEEEELTEDAYFTVTLYSFAEMKFKELEEKPCVRTTSIQATITQDNVGFGINSPYFNKNLQFSIETEIGGDLQVSVEASTKLDYEICLIPDPSGRKSLTQLKLEDIINNSEISAEKHGRGSFFIKPAFTQYLLIINAYSPANEVLTVDLKLYAKTEAYSAGATLRISQISTPWKPFFTQEVKWLPTHHGPRKRLKSNSNAQFHPTQVFVEFFKNPLVDKRLVKGTYQFFIKSETFRDYFDSVESYEDKNACEPPALSMAVFLASQDQKSYKILLDDAFYVPFGVGFWTMSAELEEGSYRFVLPKMDKGFSRGTFGIIKY